ncbi:hypothetical protein BAUCODRAFT_73114 [Baudoinia panamericana UAMH 10762]|uniref:DUF2406 domain-containing protein n=1 Tax=Baudoinia panamericana (strain UAMH 10762) TaxID=717646 RepID=M2MED3_BAUPA|nr:uncharacterized protein BAUCODRAFT_73114 [Baudoinia panamericana UAMH 10762]EMC94936.1 hypothetical protein BAUCODRAFT_73114 [Baudoinia panamericana UAMH 10762]
MDQHPSPPLGSPRGRARGFSFRSDKSGASRDKGGPAESPQDKARRDSIWKGSSKANPNAALEEKQPALLNVTEKSTLQSLRDYQHLDVNGNVIVDPDLSNPTRPRLERPLDTIRSFEKAIDNGYKRRSSYIRSDSFEQNNQYASRRSSYFGGKFKHSNRHSAMMSGGGGYYGDGRRESYMNNGYGPPRMRNGNRMASEGAIPHQRPYPQHGYHQSQDTMNTGVTNGSDSTGPWASNTDPSSENSSIDRNMVGAGKPGDQQWPQQNGYVSNGYGSNPPIMEEGGSAYGGPVQAPNGPRRPIPLGNSGDAPISPPGKLPSVARAEPEKKKGWLKRRFSKKD